MIINVTILLFLALCTYFDVRSKQIPVKLILVFGFIIGGIFLIGRYFNNDDILWRILPGIFLLLISFVTNQAMGYGDGLVILLIGLLLEININMTFIMMALLLSAVASLIILILKKGNRNTRLPFMPFLLTAWGVTMIWF
jgi:leader peptidase (prepilin peptidase)/N-methyltransferase